MARTSEYTAFLEEWKRLYEEDGLSFTKIAEQAGVARGTVKRLLEGHVEKRPKRQYEHLVDKWIEMYSKAIPMTAIAEQYGVTVQCVSKYLKEAGVDTGKRKGSPLEKFAPIWVKEYESGLTLKEIANKYGVSAQGVLNNIRDKTKMRDYSESTVKYEVREDYFDKIDTHEKAYWLGIYFGTGFNIEAPTGFIVGLGVRKEEQDMLFRFKKVMNYEREVEYSKNIAKLIFNNEKLSQQLSSYGLVKNKKDKMAIPDSLDGKFYNSFILGYFEGKGGYYAKKNGGGYLSISGGELLIEQIVNIVKQELDVSLAIKKENIKSGVTATAVSYRKNDIQKIATWLYKDVQDYSEIGDFRHKINLK